MTRPLSKSAGRWLQVGCWQGVAAAGTLAHWSRPIFTEVKKDEKTRKNPGPLVASLVRTREVNAFCLRQGVTAP